jgi:hypothetical protein
MGALGVKTLLNFTHDAAPEGGEGPSQCSASAKRRKG